MTQASPSHPSKQPSQAEAWLRGFFEHRTRLILELESGQLTKRSYIERCHDYFEESGSKPYKPEAKHFDEGLFNYQYFNTYAKYYQMLLDDSFLADRDLMRRYERKVDEYYRLKDQATLEMLELTNYCAVEAYYLDMRSGRLSGRLFEIVFTDRPLAILHSMDARIQRRLQMKGCFEQVPKKSLIDTYVNTKY